MQQAVAIAPLRMNSSVKGLVLIYGLTILSCFIVNIIVRASPIGPWSGDQINQMFWLDNVTWQLLSLWWALLSIVSGGWPFNGIRDDFTRGIVIVAASWIMGWLSAKSIYWTGLGADWIFPIVGCIFFFMAFFCFTGENWIVAGMPPHRQFFILLILIGFCTYIVTNSAVRWIPAWWFPFVQMGAATGLLAYWTRGMKQPGRGFTQMAILFLTVLICLWISHYLGLWDPAKAGVGNFWSIGYFTDDQYWLLWFMVACSVVYGVLIPIHNWPFSQIPMPWGGLAASGFCLILAYLVTKLLFGLIGPVFGTIGEALTYGYMGTNWSFVIPMLFGYGLAEPYLWAGQKTPGSWDDVT